MIHICLCLSDPNMNYCKYAGVVMKSVFCNTDKKVCFHIVCDDTVTKEEISRFQEIVSEYEQTLQVYYVDHSKWKMDFPIMERLTIGTMFRLKLPEIMPDLDKLIYLDCDLMVQLDIYELWNEDITDYYLAACHDELLLNLHPEMYVCQKGMVKESEYFNSGVMMLNLRKMREREQTLFDESIAYLSQAEVINSPDQDALNVIYHDHVKYLEDKYNRSIYVLRSNEQPIGKEIYHYMADNVDFDDMYEYDRLFLQYLIATPWGRGKTIETLIYNSFIQNRKRICAYQAAVKGMAEGKKVIVFGATSPLIDSFCQMISLDKICYYVDNFEWKKRGEIDGIQIFNPEKLKEEKLEDIIVFILSNKYAADISEQLESYGLIRNVNYIDGKELLNQRQGGYIYFRS